mmetsp:Transcript_45499/g.67042  ORF Transcript_45499/g.67042 Transcript_45499/m.67042 type:complete len:643 (+) Transcript_45499:127-2055(+)
MSLPSYSAPVYEPISVVDDFHDVPRLGRPSDISLLASSEREESVHYIYGVLFISFFICSVFVTWAMVILIFHCIGPKLVGFLSGSPFRAPKQVCNGKTRPFRRPRRVRITFLICASMVITFTILLVTKGLYSVNTAVDTLYDSTMDVQDIVKEGNEIADNLFNVGDDTEGIRDSVVVDLKTFCPAGDLSLIFGDDLAIIRVADALDELQDFIMGDLESLKEYLDEVQIGTEEVANAIDTYRQWKYQPLYFAPLVLLCTVFILGTALAWRESSPSPFRCIQSFICLPFFIAFIVLAWILAFFVAIGSVMNADACSGGVPASPDNTIMSFFAKSPIAQEQLLYTAVEYYVQGCNTDDPFEFISTYQVQLENALTESKSLMDTLRGLDIEELSQLCGNDVSASVTGFQQLDLNMRVLLESAKQTVNLVSCNRINPLYVQTFHEAICTHSMTGLSWLMACLITISVCGMTMIMLRSSWLHVKHPSSYTAFPSAQSMIAPPYEDALANGSILVTANSRVLQSLASASFDSSSRSVTSRNSSMPIPPPLLPQMHTAESRDYPSPRALAGNESIEVSIHSTPSRQSGVQTPQSAAHTPSSLSRTSRSATHAPRSGQSDVALGNRKDLQASPRPDEDPLSWEKFPRSFSK